MHILILAPYLIRGYYHVNSYHILLLAFIAQHGAFLCQPINSNGTVAYIQPHRLSNNNEFESKIFWIFYNPTQLPISI